MPFAPSLHVGEGLPRGKLCLADVHKRSPVGDTDLSLFTKAFNSERDNMAGLQKLRRFQSEAGAWRCVSGNHITRVQGHELARARAH